MWRDWFTFYRQDRRAILFLSCLILLVLVLLWFSPSDDAHTGQTVASDSLATSFASMYKEQPIVKFDRHRFDPNVADSLELLSQGFPNRVVRNILAYRRAGGVFRKVDDLARIYGLHDTLFMAVRPYIVLQSENRTMPAPKQETDVEASVRHNEGSEGDEEEHPYAEYMRAKHKPGVFVDLNAADTTELMKIPGIGPVYANMIVNYRNQLGGFHHIVQLRELKGLPENLGDWVYVDTPPSRPLRVNSLSVTALRSHPYLSFYQARAIVELRKREGDIQSVRQLLFLDEFSESDIKRLTPYLSFD